MDRRTPLSFMDSDRHTTYVEWRRSYLRRERLKNAAIVLAAMVLPPVLAFVILGYVLEVL